MVGRMINVEIILKNGVGSSKRKKKHSGMKCFEQARTEDLLDFFE